MSEHTTKISTAGGFLTVLLANINATDIFKTVIMSATGAFISFCVSVLLNHLLKRFRR